MFFEPLTLRAAAAEIPDASSRFSARYDGEENMRPKTIGSSNLLQ